MSIAAGGGHPALRERSKSEKYFQNQTSETCLIAAEAGFVLMVKETVGKKHSSLAPLIYGGKAAFA